jgi:tetratricopeptide (TPR) repeat protein
MKGAGGDMKNLRVFIISLFAVVLLACFFSGCGNGKKNPVKADKLREYAGDLVNKTLYEQAIKEYQRYLDDYSINERERANVNYIIANTYFERVKDYENALTYYLKIKHLYPDNSLMPEVNKKIVACLERLELTEDAQQALDETVQMDPTAVAKKRPGNVVAQIGNREITQGDLDFEIEQLPPSFRDQLKDPQRKLDFLREYVATELLYDTAKRSGFEKDQDVIEGAFQAKKSLMVRKLLQERVAGKVEIAMSDIELYYRDHIADFSEKDKDGKVIKEKPLAEVQQQVQQALMQQRYEQEYKGLIEKMIRAEGVKFYESRVE